MPGRLAVIGGDAAGMSAASVAKRRDPSLEVVAFEKGPHTSYSACGIPFFLGGAFDDGDRLVSRWPDEHRERGIDVRMRHEVVGIDLAARRLTVRDLHARVERTEPFDQLVIATGARAVGPRVPGIERVEPARTVDAAERFAARLARGGRRAVVIGGSYIGLEMAEALVQRGLHTTIVERADQVMGIALDADVAEHVQSAAEAEGVDVRLSTEVTEIEVDGDGEPVAVLAGDERFPADHVVLATGVKAETGLAEDAGLALGQWHGITTDDHQRCPGHDGVFAAGDCVETWHRLLERPLNVQLGTHANKQGRIAGLNATGADVAFPGVIGTSATKICRYEIARTGLTEREASEFLGRETVATTIRSKTRAAYMPGAGPIWVKLVAEPGGRLLGGQVVGVESAAKRVDVIATAVWNGMDVRELELLDLSYAPPFSPVYDPVLTAARALAAKLA
jgi:NADPH-dependent 2,4-dienoyl-CoA reductase/sulfur reductase-like enzyme